MARMAFSARYLGPTDRKGSRIVTESTNVGTPRLVTAYPYEATDPYRVAAGRHLDRIFGTYAYTASLVCDLPTKTGRIVVFDVETHAR